MVCIFGMSLWSARIDTTNLNTFRINARLSKFTIRTYILEFTDLIVWARVQIPILILSPLTIPVNSLSIFIEALFLADFILNIIKTFKHVHCIQVINYIDIIIHKGFPDTPDILLFRSKITRVGQGILLRMAWFLKQGGWLTLNPIRGRQIQFIF